MYILMGVCSISFHIFSNSWSSFCGGVNEEGIYTMETSWKLLFLKWYANIRFYENWYKSYSRSGIFCGVVGVKDSPSFKALIL